MACAARIGQAQSVPRAVVVIALLAAVPLAAGADGLVASGCSPRCWPRSWSPSSARRVLSRTVGLAEAAVATPDAGMGANK